MRLLLACLFTALVALPAGARPLADTEEKTLSQAVDSYLRATAGGDAEKIVATIPPRVLNVFAGTAGIEAAKVQKALVDQTKGLLKTTKFTDFQSGKGPFDATDSPMADGTTVTWLFVPTEFTTETKGKKTRLKQPLLALEEAGKWYFTRIDGPQQKQLVGFAYPFIDKATLPEASSTTLP